MPTVLITPTWGLEAGALCSGSDSPTCWPFPSLVLSFPMCKIDLISLPTLQSGQGLKGKGGCLRAFGKGWRARRDQRAVALFRFFSVLPPGLGYSRREGALLHRGVEMGVRPAWWWHGLQGGKAGEAEPRVQMPITLTPATTLCV